METEIRRLIANNTDFNFELNSVVINSAQAARDIANMVMNYIHWMELHVTFNTRTQKYLYWEDSYTAEALFEVYINENTP
jgi:hypothetical protein